MNNEGKIIRNSIRTPDGTELISANRHDFVEYVDENGCYYAVDGGSEYLRRVCDKDDYVDTTVYHTDDFNVVREVFLWGTYGINGDQPIQYKALKDLEDAHIVAILETQTHLAPYVKDIFLKEQMVRK